MYVYVCECECMRVCMCVSACIRAYVCVCEYECVCVCVCVFQCVDGMRQSHDQIKQDLASCCIFTQEFQEIPISCGDGVYK